MQKQSYLVFFAFWPACSLTTTVGPSLYGPVDRGSGRGAGRTEGAFCKGRSKQTEGGILPQYQIERTGYRKKPAVPYYSSTRDRRGWVIRRSIVNVFTPRACDWGLTALRPVEALRARTPAPSQRIRFARNSLIPICACVSCLFVWRPPQHAVSPTTRARALKTMGGLAE